jgi:hypothetical protein
MTEHDAIRLLEAVPTIHHILAGELTPAALPPAIATRLRSLNWVARTTTLANLSRASLLFRDAWGPCESRVAINTENGALCITDIASAFPNLRELSASNIAPDVAMNELRLPPTLVKVDLFKAATTEFADGMLRRLAAASPRQLPRLAEVNVRASTNIAPLTTFASTLTSIALRPSGHDDVQTSRDTDTAILAMEAALVQLVGLENAVLPTLPTARCFLGGTHTRLRTLKVRSIDAPEAPFAALAKACPRLVLVMSSMAQPDWDPAALARAGWTLRGTPPEALRRSFVPVF